MSQKFERYMPEGLPASGLITIASIPAAASTVTIDGVVYTAGTNFRVAGARNILETIEDVARSLTAAINDEPEDRIDAVAGDTITPLKSVYAKQYGNQVLIVSRVPGVAGNSIALATSAALVYVLSGATLSGGTAGGPLGSIVTTTTPGAYTKRTTTITAGGTSQQLMAANAARKVLFVANPFDVSETIHVEIGGAAVADRCIPILPGGSLTLTGADAPAGAIHVISATTGKYVVAYEA